MKNKIPLETQFKTITGQIAATLEGNYVSFYCDLTYPEYKEQPFYPVEYIMYDEDGDICAHGTVYLQWLNSSPYSINTHNSKPVRVLLREN